MSGTTGGGPPFDLSGAGVEAPASSPRPPSGSEASHEHADGSAEPHEEGWIWRRLHAFDHWQQRRRGVRFVVAVFKKFGDDQGTQLAALISYYGFISLFPLLLVLVTVLGFVLQGDPHERTVIVNGTLGQFPLISDQINLQGLKGSGAALAVGIVGSLLAGLGIMGATQNAMNRIWHVPFRKRRNWIFWRLRGLATLVVLGGVSIVSAAAGGFVGTASHGTIALVGGVLVALAANFALFMVAFKALPAIDLGWRTLLPGVITATVLWQGLEHLGGYYLNHELRHTGPLYGTFALVLGLLAWLYLGGQFVVLSAEVNVVKAWRLWPRSLFGDPLLEADKRALRTSAETEERVPQEDVDVDFREGG